MNISSYLSASLLKYGDCRIPLINLLSSNSNYFYKHQPNDSVKKFLIEKLFFKIIRMRKLKLKKLVSQYIKFSN